MVHLGAAVSLAAGVLSTAAWSVSFYPQALLNYRRKSVVGLSLDFLHLNPLGFACYTAFTVTLLFSHEVRKQYESRHNGHAPQVRWNDAAFASHALLISLFTLGQSFYYKRASSQQVSPYNRSVITVILVAIAGATLLSTFTNLLAWLDLVYFLSYIKLYISSAKMLPQAYINYKRKSTVGWSIINILLDFTGGILSLFQLVLDSYLADDWTGITGNPGKLGLSMLSICFDIFFMLQHYVLYRHSRSNELGKTVEESVGAGAEGDDEAVQSREERRHLLA